MANVLFVCMGNICRSPTAHGVFEHLARTRGYDGRISVDSAGTSGFHVGDPPDQRAQATALARGVDLSPQRARQVAPADFETFDYVCAMDYDNLAVLKRWRPKKFTGRLDLFCNFTPELKGQPIPDPYYGGARGFEKVYDLIERASEGLLAVIEREKFSGGQAG
ncbi:MAG: low molecular weight protein-tyrosine-phosphatase [Candidatus Hydrogenedentota bacterium]